jgi:phospholipid/cholesterol/gamma-HCH transport system permease protein
MLAGRVSAAMTAEIGTMEVTEQINAPHSHERAFHRYLVTPRTIAMPLLIASGNGKGGRRKVGSKGL